MYSTYSTVQYSTVQYSTVQYSTVQYSTVQYSTDEQLVTRLMKNRILQCQYYATLLPKVGYICPCLVLYALRFSETLSV